MRFSAVIMGFWGENLCCDDKTVTDLFATVGIKNGVT